MWYMLHFNKFITIDKNIMNFDLLNIKKCGIIIYIK